jgi:hypothetical protein
MRLQLFLTLAVVTLCLNGILRAEESPEDLIKQLENTDTAQREKAGEKLRALGAAVIPALRAAKPASEEAVARVRNLLTDITVDTSKLNAGDADLVHELAREEGQGKRYANATKLYARAQRIYAMLKDDADERKDKANAKRYKEKRDLCDRMKDKADHKAKGETHTGVNLGVVHIGVSHDTSDDWE